MKNTRIAGWALAIFILTLPIWLQQINDYFVHVVITIGVYIILTLSLNIIVGYAGQFALGHAAFYGIGAYTASLLMVNYGLSFWLALPISAMVTGLFGFLLGTPVIRLKGDYLGIVTLGFGEIVRLIFVNWIDVTNGPMGIPGIPSPELFGYSFSQKLDYYYLIAFLVLITIFVVNRILRSGIGLTLLVVREDEIAAGSMGIQSTKLKLLAFTIGAFFAGIAGAFWASYISFISPDSFQYIDSVSILSMVILGGMGTIPGSILGATILTITPEVLRFVSDNRMMLLGLSLILMMIFKPSGVWGENRRKGNTYGALRR